MPRRARAPTNYEKSTREIVDAVVELRRLRKPNLSEYARLHNLPYQRLHRAFNGGNNRSTRAPTNRKLSDVQEASLVYYLDAVDAVGFGVTKYMVEAQANHLLKQAFEDAIDSEPDILDLRLWEDYDVDDDLLSALDTTYKGALAMAQATQGLAKALQQTKAAEIARAERRERAVHRRRLNEGGPLYAKDARRMVIEREQDELIEIQRKLQERNLKSIKRLIAALKLSTIRRLGAAWLGLAARQPYDPYTIYIATRDTTALKVRQQQERAQAEEVAMFDTQQTSGQDAESSEESSVGYSSPLSRFYNNDLLNEHYSNKLRRISGRSLYKQIRWAMMAEYDLAHQGKEPVNLQHMDHCYDYIRQVIMCGADMAVAGEDIQMEAHSLVSHIYVGTGIMFITF
ncbi:hypothetical protein J3E72DRAFT_273879 [Bipolaris maydis]|nr:hypothetical protein J3E72DRAFT_273879 [Bipolaris maydis]